MDTKATEALSDMLQGSFGGKVEVTPDARRTLSDADIEEAVRKHGQEDFGEVSYEEYCAYGAWRLRTHGTPAVSRHRSSEQELIIVITTSDGYRTVTTVYSDR